MVVQLGIAPRGRWPYLDRGLAAADNSLGRVRAVARRSWVGLLVATLAMIALLGSLLAWNIAKRGENTLIGAVLVGVAALVGFFSYARAPRAIEVREGGLVVRALLRNAVLIDWDDIAGGRIAISRLGRKPRVVVLKTHAGDTLDVSDDDYSEVGVLIDALVMHTHGKIKDERLV